MMRLRLAGRGVAFMVDGHLVPLDTVCKHSRHVVYDDDDDAVIE
jgi:hypothetical protein